MFHNNLRAQRLRRGLSQKQVADFLSVSAQSVSKWEKGDALPSIDYLPMLADCLNCDINAFFAKEEQETSNFDEIVLYFSTMTEILNEEKNHDELYELMTEKPAVVDAAISICKKLMAHKVVNIRWIRGMIGCNESEARTLVTYLQRCELVDKLDIDDFYYVIKDAVEGYILLIKMQLRVCEMQNEIAELDAMHEAANKEKPGNIL